MDSRSCFLIFSTWTSTPCSRLKYTLAATSAPATTTISAPMISFFRFTLTLPRDQRTPLQSRQ